MPTLGEELKRLREARGISLAEIAEATRIGTRFLKAIETDHFSVLPGGIFTRSFIRAYAKHVGMDEQEAVKLYTQQLTGAGGEAEANGPLPTQEPITTQARPRSKSHETPAVPLKPRPMPVEPVTLRQVAPVTLRRQTPANWARVTIAAAIFLFVGVVVVTLIKQLNRPSTTRTSQPPAEEIRNEATKPDRHNEVSPDASAPRSAVSTIPTASAKPAPTPAEGERASSDGRFFVKLEASSGDSWIKYQVDDASPTQMILKQGQIQEIPAALNQIILNYGNRQILKLTINNREANFPPDTPKFAAQVVISRDNLGSFFQ